MAEGTETGRVEPLPLVRSPRARPAPLAGERYATFDGTAASWTPSEAFGFPGAADQTLELWVRVPDPPPGPAVLLQAQGASPQKGSPASVTQISVSGGGTLTLGAVSTTGSFASSSPSGFDFEAGQWQHVAWVSEPASGRLRVWVDGTLSWTVTLPTDWGTVGGDLSYMLGSTSKVAPGFGDIDGVRLWSVARTEEQVRLAACRPVTAAEDADLVFEHDFEAGFSPRMGSATTLSFTEGTITAQTAAHPWAE